jgi:hypothetical protein
MPYSSFFAAGRFTRVLAASLVLSLVLQPALLMAAASPEQERTRACAQSAHLWTAARRPGTNQAIGVKKWIEMQLNPEQIDDSLLEARLQSFPAMHLSQQDLLAGFPIRRCDSCRSRRKVPCPRIGGARHLPEPGLRLRRKAAEAGAGSGQTAGLSP